MTPPPLTTPAVRRYARLWAWPVIALQVACTPAPSPAPPAAVAPAGSLPVAPSPAPVAEPRVEPPPPPPPTDAPDDGVVPLQGELPPCLSDEERAAGCRASCEDDFFVRRKSLRCPPTATAVLDGEGIMGMRGTDPDTLLVARSKTVRLRALRVEPLDDEAPPMLTGKLRRAFLDPLRQCWKQEAYAGVPPALSLHARMTPEGTITRWSVLGPAGAYRSCVDAALTRQPLHGAREGSVTVRVRATAWVMTEPPQASE